jgi:hypothetical protein
MTYANIKRKYSIFLLFLLLVTCNLRTISFPVKGEKQDITRAYTKVEYRFVDYDALNFSLFVSPDGSDSNPGTQERPYRSITKAAETAKAGDTVLVREGVYIESIKFWNSGTEKKPIIFFAEEGVVIEGPDDLPFWRGILQLFNLRHITISGFYLKDSKWFGVQIDECSYITIDSCFVENTEASGIWAINSDHILIINNRVRNACTFAGGPEGSPHANAGAQECITVNGVDTFQVLYNEVYESSVGLYGGEGVCLKGGCFNGEVAYNLVHDNVRIGLYAGSWDDVVSFHGNVVYDNLQGIGVSSETGWPTNNIQIYNNLVFNNSCHGIVVSAWVMNGPRDNISIIGNTVVGNGYGSFSGGITIQPEANANNITVRNNIASGNNVWQIMSDSPEKNVTCDHNLINGFRGERSHETRGTEYKEGDPGFVKNVDIGLAHDPLFIRVNGYALRNDSVAVDSGSPDGAPSKDFLGNMRLQGDGVDIGAFEYPSTTWNWTHNYEGTVWDWTSDVKMEPASDFRWINADDVPFTQRSIASVALDGKIYVMGGIRLYEYDTVTGVWTRLEDLPVTSRDLSAVEVDGMIYVIGGRGGDFLSSVEKYDPDTDSWSSCAPMLTPRGRHAAAVLEGKIYVFGGFTGDWDVLDTVEEYDPVADTWTPRAPMPVSTLGEAVTVGDKIFLISHGWGGLVMEYDAVADTWRSLTTMPTMRRDFAVAALDSCIYIIGGKYSTNDEYSANVEVYSLETGAWRIQAPMKTRRSGLATVKVDDRIYAIGGEGKDGVLKIVEVFGPPQESPSPIIDPEPEPEPELESEPEPELESQEEEEKPSGIPGFGIRSILEGILIYSLIAYIIRNKRYMNAKVCK